MKYNNHQNCQPPQAIYIIPESHTYPLVVKGHARNINAESTTKYVYASGTKPYRLVGNTTANRKSLIKQLRPTRGRYLSQLRGSRLWQYRLLLFDLQRTVSHDLAIAL